jgi:peroxiredoxin
MNAEPAFATLPLVAALTLFALPATAAEEKKKEPEKSEATPKPVRAVPRLLVPPVTSGFTRITWWNGETLRGELESADAATLAWKSPLFSDAMKVKKEVIRRIDYNVNFQRPEGSFRLALTDGSHFTGELEKLDGETVTFNSAACGPVRVKRDQVAVLERIAGDGVIAAGPLAILPDKAASRTDNNGNAVTPLFLAAAGRAATPGFNQSSHRPLDLPDKSVVDLHIRTESIPDFKLTAATPGDFVAVETWGDELVLLYGERFASAGKRFKDADREAHVRLAWDRPAQRAVLYGGDGTVWAEISPLPAEKVAEPKKEEARPAGSWLRRLFGGEEPRPAQEASQRAKPLKGVTLHNKGSGIVVERFAVWDWKGSAPAPAIVGSAAVETDSEILAGEPVSLVDGKLTVPASGGGTKDIPLAQVRALRWPREVKSGRDPAQTDIWFSDGNLLRGQLTEATDTHAIVATGYSEPVRAALARCRAVVLPEPANKPDPVPLTKLDVIRAGELSLHGTIHPEGGELPRFLPFGAESALTPAVNSDLTMTRSIADDEKFERAPALLHVKTKETLPVTLQSVTREKVEFTWDAAENHALDTAQLHAVQFSAPAADGKGFDGSGWRSITEDGKGISRKDGAVVLQPGAGIGHPWLLQGGDINFRMDQDNGNGVAGMRIRLFCQGTDRESSTVNFLLGEFGGGEIYCGLERTEGQFSSSTQVSGSGPAAIRITFSGDKVELWVNKVRAVSTTIANAQIRANRAPAPAAKKGGTGIIIETASLWGNQMGSVKVMDLSMDTSPCMAGPPPFTEDARREALLLPRLRREDPPRQVLIGRNGDLLRGELEGITATHLAFRSGLENFNVPVERVAAAVWLIVPPKPEPKKDEPAPKPDKQKEDEILAPDSSGDAVFIVVKAAPPPLTEKKETKPEPKKDEKKQEAVKPGLQWLDLTNGGRLALKVDAWTADTVNGTHPLLGKLRIPRRLVHHFSLKEPPPPAALTALSEWKLEPTPDPVPPEGDGTESPLAGKPAADFKLPMLEGEDFELSKAKGKVVVLDFWATWCGPCVKSLPGLIEAMSEFPPEDVQFLAVNQGESKEQVKKFLSGRGWQMPVAFDADQKVAQKFGVEGIPYTVVIDREGNIAFTKTGAEPNGEKKIADAVQKALDAPGPEKEKKEEKDAPKAKPDDSLLPEPKGI